MEELIKQCTSFSEVGRILGYNYYNGRVKKIILKKCNEIGIDIEKQIKDYNERKVYCIECGKEITGDDRFRRKFCCSSCSAKYNNKLRRPVTNEQREKVSNTLRKKYKNGELIPYNKGIFKDKTNANEIQYRKEICKKDKNKVRYVPVIEKVCPNCQQTYYGTIHQIYCSHICAVTSVGVKEKLRQKQLEKIANGTHSGWKSRNITSYPEQFWISVLDNNNIKYKREDFSTKKYFLDFLIERDGQKIDLEIDGKQHKFRKEHDEERDKYLTDLGYVVYRIPWKSLNNEEGKEYMKKEIDKFLKFYNKE